MPEATPLPSDANQLPLFQLGPQADRPVCQETRLQDGAPLFHALVPDQELHKGVISPSTEQVARDTVRRCETLEPETVATCQGQTRDEAHAILQGILARHSEA